MFGLYGVMVALHPKPEAPDVPAMIRDVQTYYAQGQFDLLLGAILPLVDLIPQEPALHNVAGAAYAGVGRFADAVASYDRAIALQPGLVEAYSNRGVALKALGRLDEALASYDGALSLDPGAVAGHYNRANLLRELRRFGEALAAYDRVIVLQPDHADAHCNRGNLLQQQERFDEALSSYDRALAARPDFADAHINRGNVLHDLRRMDEAQRSYAAAIRLNPESAEARARSLFLGAHMCDWTAFEDGARVAALGVETDAISPFTLLALDDDAARGLARSRAWAKASYPSRVHVMPAARSPRIRIGYFSADFHSHATMYLMAGLFELHDRAQFEVHAFSYGPDRRDAMRQRAADAFEHFHGVRGLDDAGIAAFARAKGIDIAVDLKGYTQDSRPAIFALGAAPVQAAWIGYPGTSGADFIDYIVADPIVIPAGQRAHYSEKLICLPNSYQVNDDRRPIAAEVPSRAALGLPAEGFIFACFNNSYKISPDAFDIWMRLLAQVDGSVLWLLRDNDRVAANLRREAEARGIAGDRLVFADRVPMADHLARHAHADLFLDTFACNAHTTASDALWAGLPLVTKMGEGFAARVAGSLLHAAGLSELATDSDEAYEALALALARDPKRLGAIRTHLTEHRLTMPLFDTARFTRDLEQGYRLAFERHRSGLVPDHIDVQSQAE